MVPDNYYMADFETTTTPEDCRVWAWGVCHIESESISVGIDIDSFLAWCFETPRVVYFHNLIFDSAFIIDRIMKLGYEYTDDNRPSNNQFTCVISALGKIYTMKISHRGVTVEFRDSLKKIPMSVAATARAFGLDILKGEIDYNAPRPIGHQLTHQERAYLDNDILIVARALKHQLNQGLDKLTVGSDALANYKDSLGSLFTRYFPSVDADTDADIRHSYRGGFTYCDPRTAQKIQGAGIVLDVNSLYPYVMRTKLLPTGNPIYHEGWGDTTDEFPLAVRHICFTAELKADHIPCIQIKGSSIYNAVDYLKSVDEPTWLWCTSVDWKLWNTQYDIEIIACDATYLMHGEYGLFDEYIDYWSEIKANSVGGMRALAKLMLNSLYGKFATNPDVTGKYPVLDGDVVKLKLGEEELREPIYIPMGTFITAYAREKTITSAQANYSRVMYADTDSLHLSGTELPDGLEVHESKLGAWKIEEEFDRALFIRAKQYAEQLVDGSTSVHIAGMPRNVAQKLTIEDICNGAEFGGKLVPVRVPGGMILRDTTFTIKFPELD